MSDQLFHPSNGLGLYKELIAIDADKVVIARKANINSIEAALKALPKSGTKRRKIYEYLERQGVIGATDEEIETALQISGNTVRPTRGGLVEDGFVKDAGFNRPTRSGNDATVWTVKR
jgi:transcription initiation factor IIE alpha subunit